MKRNKEILRKRFAELGDSEAVRRLDSLKGEYVFLSIDDEKTYKTKKQNDTFHGLLQCYYGSGCSSFESFKELREMYKESANLIEISYKNKLSQEAKVMIWKAVRLLPLKKKDKEEMIELLKGKKIKEGSWSDITKENAKLTIDLLLDQMNESGVMGSKMGWKYQEILTGMGIEV